MSSPQALRTDRTTLRQLPQRGSHDRAVIDAILDEALFCHLGFTTPRTPLSSPQDTQPFVLPAIHARVEDRIYVHGSAASRMLRALADGASVCLTATLLDGLVLARSAFHHSMNYRSVVVLGKAQLVVDEAEKLMALRAIVEHVARGRWDEVRTPNEKEMKATAVLSLPLTEASAKVRTGMPVDDEEDFALPVWAGVLPLRLVAGDLVAESRLVSSIAPTPAVVEAARRGR
jgi:nitroimidazol reductase NimA-like FMN-containing flavoprotein (pyridoxamine 5'-phosphate oxidase superfamily)